MKTITKIWILLLMGVVVSSCEKIVDDYRDNPNTVKYSDKEAYIFTQYNLGKTYGHGLGYLLSHQFSVTDYPEETQGYIQDSRLYDVWSYFFVDVGKYAILLEQSKDPYYKAQGKFAKVQVRYLTVNIFGKYPSKALLGRIEPFPSDDYDTLQTLAPKLLLELDTVESLCPELKGQCKMFRSVLGESLSDTTYQEPLSLQYANDQKSWYPLYASITQYGYVSLAPADSLVLLLAQYQDPRLALVADTTNGRIKGFPYGVYESNVDNFASLPETFYTKDKKALLMTWSFACFMQAKLQFEQSNMPEAKKWYEAGITASFRELNIPDVSTYLVQSGVAWDDNDGLNQITKQAWIATATAGSGWLGWFILRENPIYSVPLQYLFFPAIVRGSK